MSENNEAKVKLTLEQQVEKEMGNVAEEFGKKIAEMGVAVISVEKVMELFNKTMETAIEEFNDGQKAAWGTKVMLEGLGDTTKLTKKDVENLSEAYSKQTGTMDDMVQIGINKAIQANSNLNYQQLNQMIPTALALAKVQGDGKITEENYAAAMQTLATAGEYPERALRALRSTGMGLNEQQLGNIKTLLKAKDTTEAYTLVLGYLGDKTKTVLNNHEGLNQASGELETAWRQYLTPAGKLFGTALEYIEIALTRLLQLLPKVQNVYKTWGESILQWAHIHKKTTDEVVKEAVDADKKMTDAKKKSLADIAKAEALAAIDKKKKTKEELVAEKKQQEKHTEELIKTKEEKMRNYFKTRESDLKVLLEKEKAAEKEHDEYIADLDRGSWAARLFGEKMNAEQRKLTERGVQDFLTTISDLTSSKNQAAWEVGKQASAIQAGIKAAEGAVSAYASMAPIPFIGPGLGLIEAGALLYYGEEQVRKIESQTFPAAAQGAFVPGSPTGIPYIIGDQNKNEHVLNDEHIDKLAARLGGGVQSVHFVVNKRSVQAITVSTKQSEFRLKKTGQIP